MIAFRSRTFVLKPLCARPASHWPRGVKPTSRCSSQAPAAPLFPFFQRGFSWQIFIVRAACISVRYFIVDNFDLSKINRAELRPLVRCHGHSRFVKDRHHSELPFTSQVLSYAPVFHDQQSMREVL